MSGLSDWMGYRLQIRVTYMLEPIHIVLAPNTQINDFS